MNTRPFLVIAATLFLTAAPAAYSGDNSPAMKPASSVAEMLQRRQENQLREQLVKDGRTDEVQKLDQQIARRQQERQQKVVAQMNEELARTAKSEAASTTAILDACDKETLRMRQMKSANVDKNMTEITTR